MFVLLLQSPNSFSKQDFLDFQSLAPTKSAINIYWEDQPLSYVEDSDDDHARVRGRGILSYVICNFICVILYFRTLFIPLEKAGCLFLSLAKPKLSGMWENTPDVEGLIIMHLVGRMSLQSPEWKHSQIAMSMAASSWRPVWQTYQAEAVISGNDTGWRSEFWRLPGDVPI